MLLVVMPEALTALTVNLSDGCLHLQNVLLGAGVQCFLDHRLFGAGIATEGVLQARVASQPLVDLDESLGSGQQADESIVEFLSRGVLDGLLADADLLCNRFEEVDLLHLEPHGGQSGARRVVREASSAG